MASFITDLLDSAVKNIHPIEWLNNTKKSIVSVGEERKKFKQILRPVKNQKNSKNVTPDDLARKTLSPFMLAVADCMGSVCFYKKEDERNEGKNETLSDFEKRRVALYFSGGGYELLDYLCKYGIGYVFLLPLIVYRVIKFGLLILPRWLDFSLTLYSLAPIDENGDLAKESLPAMLGRYFIKGLAKIPQLTFLFLRSMVDSVESTKKASERGWGWTVVSAVTGAACLFVLTGGIGALATASSFVGSLVFSAASSNSAAVVSIPLVAGADIVVPDEDIGGVVGFIGGCFNGITNLASRVYRWFVPAKVKDPYSIDSNSERSVSRSGSIAEETGMIASTSRNNSISDVAENRIASSPIIRRNSNVSDALAAASISRSNSISAPVIRGGSSDAQYQPVSTIDNGAVDEKNINLEKSSCKNDTGYIGLKLFDDWMPTTQTKTIASEMTQQYDYSP